MRDSKNDVHMHDEAGDSKPGWSATRLLTTTLLTVALAGASVGTCYGAGLFDIMRGGSQSAATSATAASSAATSSAATSAAATSAASNAASAAAVSSTQLTQTVSDGTNPNSTIEHYSWDELAAISDQIAASGSEEAALAIAEQDGLCTADGRLDGTQTKSIVLKNGLRTSATIVGFYHDTISGTTGKAGITFMFSTVVADCAANIERTNSYGWLGSLDRLWLSTDMTRLLPDDLAADVIAVDKLSNNVGETEDVSSVTATSDKLWLFSCGELVGDTSSMMDDYENDSDRQILNAEGAQYQLFGDMGISAGTSNGILAKVGDGLSSTWLLRSAEPSNDATFYMVEDDGSLSRGGGIGYRYGMVPGFCIGTAASTASATPAATAQASEPAVIHMDLSDSTTYYNVNIWLSNFAETGFLRDGHFDVSEGDYKRMADFADGHMQINDRDWYEDAPSEDGYTEIGADYRVRLAWSKIEYVTNYYFGVDVTSDMVANASSFHEYGRTLQDGYLYLALLRGDAACGVANATSVQELGDNRFEVTCHVYRIISQSEGSDIFGWSPEQLAQKESQSSYGGTSGGDYTCVIQASYDDDGDIHYQMVSCDPA